MKASNLEGNLNSLSQSTSNSKPPLYDYLKESRMKRQEMARSNLNRDHTKSSPNLSNKGSKFDPQMHNWKAYLQNKKLSKEEKMDLIQENVKVLEEKALRQERLINSVGGPADQFKYEYKNNEVNDMLIDAIQAKLAMLDQMK